LKKLCILTLLLALVSLSLGAQTAASPGFQLLSVDLGYGAGWDLAASQQITPAFFGLNIRVANNLSAGIQTLTQGGNSDNYLILKYNFLPQARATVGFGVQNPAVAASSIGFEVIPFSRSVGGQAATEFKFIAKYDAPFTNLTQGKILFALALGIGF
jgi:hypothetical protein